MTEGKKSAVNLHKKQLNILILNLGSRKKNIYTIQEAKINLSKSHVEQTYGKTVLFHIWQAWWMETNENT